MTIAVFCVFSHSSNDLRSSFRLGLHVKNLDVLNCAQRFQKCVISYYKKDVFFTRVDVLKNVLFVCVARRGRERCLFARVAMVKYVLFVCDARSDRENCLFGRSEVKCVLFG